MAQFIDPKSGEVLSLPLQSETSGLNFGDAKMTVTARLLPRFMVFDSLDDVRIVDDGMKEAIPVFW